MATGCQQLFGLPAVSVPDASPRAPDAAAGTCVASTPQDNFPAAATACPRSVNGDPLDWTESGAGDVAVAGNTMTFVLSRSGNAAIQCTSDLMFPVTSNGMFVEVVHALGGPGTTTYFELTGIVRMQVRDGMLGLRDLSAGTEPVRIPYDATAMRWWRLSTDADGNVAADYSDDAADATRWRTLWIVGHTFATTQITLGAETLANLDATNTAQFRHLNTCPR